MSVDRYRHLTEQVLPEQAEPDWPVQLDHCFQRIVLDNLVGDEWYEHIESPAYSNLTEEQATRAVEIAESMLNDPERVRVLNEQSLEFRGHA